MPQPILNTFGGTKVYSLYSGSAALNDQQIVAGQGRLNQVVPHVAQQVLSGVGITFYDAAVATSGGPFAASGHRILASINTPQGGSGSLSAAGVPINLGVPFLSGLCVATKSGQVGVTVIYSPEDLR